MRRGRDRARRYKAYFRWTHYPFKLKTMEMPVETDACASVTAAFLQVRALAGKQVVGS
jgi:hypothetical protein